MNRNHHHTRHTCRPSSARQGQEIDSDASWQLQRTQPGAIHVPFPTAPEKRQSCSSISFCLMNAPDRTASRGQDKKTEMQIALRSVLCGPHSLAFGDSESSHYFFTAGHRCCSQLTGLMKTLREKLAKKCALAVSVVV